VPGNYLIALVVGRGSPRAYDLQTVSVTYPDPLVPLDTIKYNGIYPGVQVGNSFYQFPYDTSQGPPTLQVVVLNRSDLGLLANLSIPQPSSPGYYNSLAQYLQQLPNTDLVIITHPHGLAQPPQTSLASLDSALRKIGGTLPAKWTLSTGSCWSGGTDNCRAGTGWASWQQGAFDTGSFSVIGVPGLAVGQAWRETAAQTGTQDGGIAGYLTKGTPTETGGTSYYTVVNGGPGQYEPVDTCSGSRCAVRIGVSVRGTTSAGSTVITSVTPIAGYAIGATIAGPGIPSGTTIDTAAYGGGIATLYLSKAATASAAGVGLTVYQDYDPPQANGLHVVALDRTTLAPILNQTVTNTTDLLSAFRTTGPYAKVGHFLPSPGMDDQRLIIMQSVGNGIVSGKATTALLQYLDELGGTPDLLLETMAGHSRYALVGAATNLRWRNASALESSTATPAIPNNSRHFQTGTISGAVKRDRDGLYAPLGRRPDRVDQSRPLPNPLPAGRALAVRPGHPIAELHRRPHRAERSPRRALGVPRFELAQQLGLQRRDAEGPELH
jgi:hypothetical protein